MRCGLPPPDRRHQTPGLPRLFRACLRLRTEDRRSRRTAHFSTRLQAVDPAGHRQTQQRASTATDRADTGEWKLCRLLGVEFLRRFLMHVLPKGFHKLRYYGLWHPSKRHLQERARLLLSLLAPVRLAECLLIAEVAAEADRAQQGEGGPAGASSPSCPHCGSHRVQHLQERCRGPSP